MTVPRDGKREVRATLERHGLSPNKKLGQNFLVDPALLDAIPGDAGVQAGDRVLEVGPGLGGLTRRLLGAGARVMAVEIDHGFVRLLRESLAAELDSGALGLVEGDVLAPGESFHPEVEDWWKAGPPPRLVANLPYSVSGPFLGRLPGRPLAGAVLLLQREVARKAAAGVGEEGYGPLSIRLALRFSVSLGRKVPADVFWPRPKVESGFLHLSPLADAEDVEEGILREVLRDSFGQRRKRLLPRLEKSLPEAARRMRELGIPDDARPETVAPSVWWEAAKAVRIPSS